MGFQSYQQSNRRDQYELFGLSSKIGVGSTPVSINISTDCGDSGWIKQKLLQVDTSSRPNSPPQFNIGWFTDSNRYGTSPDANPTVVGGKVNVRVIHDAGAGEPKDPDGDPITYTWDFDSSSSAWVRNVGNQVKGSYGLHDEGYYNLMADTAGFHTVTATACDSLGACSTRSSTFEVIPPNPIRRRPVRPKRKHSGRFPLHRLALRKATARWEEPSITPRMYGTINYRAIPTIRRTI